MNNICKLNREPARIAQGIAALFSLVAMVWAPGCSKDKGNYSYQPINEISVKLDKDTYMIKQFDTLRLDPIVSSTMGEDLSYRWYINGNKVLKENIVISTERKLNALIPVDPASLPYNLFLQVTDNASGVSTFFEYSLLVSGQYSQGWMLLESLPGGKADISLIDPDFNIKRNVYSKANNNTFLPDDAFRILSLSSLIDQNNYVLTANNIIQLNKVTFSFLAGPSDLFYEIPGVMKPEIVNLQGGLQPLPAIYIINNGQLHYFNAIYVLGKFGPSIYSNGAHLAPFMAMGEGSAPVTVFDDKNGRFLRLPSITATSLLPFQPNAVNPQPFDLNNVKDTLLALERGARGYYYGIFKNKGNRYLYTINQSATRDSLVSVGYQEVLNSPEFSQASLFTFSWSVPLMYYSVANKIYLYDMLANNSRLLYEFPAGEQVTALQMEHVSVNFFIPGTPFENKRIAVATYDAAAQGRVYYLNLTATGEVTDNHYAQKFEGFGKVISLAYKLNK